MKQATCAADSYTASSSTIGRFRDGALTCWRRQLGKLGDHPFTSSLVSLRGGKAISIPSNPPVLAAGINYFFALLPDECARATMLGVGERFRKSHRVFGAPVGSDNLHMTLCPMGKPERLRLPLEAALLAAAEEVREASFMITLDAVMRFTARDGQFPFVLCSDSATTDAALGLRKAVAAAQSRVGLQVSGVSSFLPHVSLLHGAGIDAIEEAVVPIQWQATEFVLIRSFFGESRFEVIGRWPLANRARSESIDLLDELANMPELPEIPDAY